MYRYLIVLNSFMICRLPAGGHGRICTGFSRRDLRRYMHPISGYGEMKGESSDLVRYMLSGPKIIFREFFRPATLKISSFEIYWIRLIWKSLFLSSNLSEIRFKIASWVSQMRVPSQFPLGFHVNSIRRGLDIGRTYRDVGWDWRTIAALFCVTQAFWAWGFLKMSKHKTKHIKNIGIRI